MRMEISAPPLVSASFVALVVVLFVFLVTLVKLYRARAGAAPGAIRRRAIIVSGGLACWLGLTGTLAAGGFFADFGGVPPRIMLAIVPSLLAVLVFGAFGPGVPNVPATWLVAPQVFRVVMELILWRLAAARALPEVMTFHGRNFDVLTGLSAPVVAWAMARGRIGSRGLLLWNAMGLVLLTSVVLHGLLSTPTVFRMLVTDPPNAIIGGFPFIWLPTFVVPVAYLLHVLSLRRILTHWSRP
jgi:hypothetical protein